MTDLDDFRRQLDMLDERLLRLLGERFEVCRRVARHKREHGIPMMQPERVTQVRARYIARGYSAELPPDFVDELFEVLISATCQLEDEIIKSPPTAADEAVP